MKISVIVGLIVAVHVAVAVVVMTPGCTSVNQQPAYEQDNPVVALPDIPVMPPTIEPEPVVANPVVLPPVTTPVDVPEKPVSDNIYVIQNGDSLSKIAARHGVKTAELQELNNIADPNKIRIGQKLILPAYAKPSQSKPSAEKVASAAASATASADDGTYVVKSGDALSKIAKKFGVKQADLMAANGIKDANKIRIGQKLKIPDGAAKAAAPKAEAPKAKAPKAEAVPAVDAPKADAPAVPAVEAEAIAAPAEPPAFDVPSDALDYTVNGGDTIDSLAGLFGVSASEIRRVNNLPAGAELSEGQHIVIPPAR